MKGQESSSQSRLDETKATVQRLRSLGSQYERQVQETRQLLERATLDLDHSGATVRRVVRTSSCDTLLVQLRAGKKINRESKDLKNYMLFCECRCSGGPFLGVGTSRGAGRGLWGRWRFNML